MKKKSIKTITTKTVTETKKITTTITTIEQTQTTPKLLISLFKLIKTIFTGVTINYLTKIFFESPPN